MRNATILIVEDDAILAMNLRRMISLMGYTVAGPIASGEKAITYLEENGVDLVLMDIELAGTMNGITVAETINQASDIPIVFLTGFSHDPLLEQAKIAGPYGYLIKPVPERELAATLDMALHRHVLDRKLKESQKALGKSEAKYRHLFENSPLGIFRATLGGKALAVNAEMARLYGCDTPEEALRDFTDLAKQFYRDPTRRQEFVSQLRENGVVDNFEYEGRKKNGESVWISMNAKLTHSDESGGEQVIDGFAIDITERRRAEVYREMGREALNLLNDPSGLSESIQQVLDVLKMRTGFDAVGIRLQTGADFPYIAQRGFSDNFLLVENTLVRRAADGNVCRDKNGNVMLAGTCGQVISGEIDVNDPLFTPGGSFWVNDSAQLLDTPHSSGHKFCRRNQCIHHNYASFALVPIRNKERIVGLIHFCDHHKGCFTRNSIEILEGIASHLGTALMRKQAEEENKSLQAQLFKAQKMEAIGTLAGGIAHDFNNILGAILGYTEMAIDASPSGSTAAKDMDKVLEAGNRAASLVQQILAFSRQVETNRAPLKPGLIAREVLKLLRPTLPSTIAIRQQIDTTTRSIYADPTQVHQIMMNLCTNAFHAMEQTGGILDITLKDCELSRADLLGQPEVQPGKFVELSVIDSGAGINPEIWGKIFDPYFTTKGIGKGTGMGLAIVHGIVTSYGGFITSENNLEQGTIFRVYFPAIEEEMVASEVKSVEAAPSGQERILFIDDEEILAELGKTMLERLGYEVTVRTSSLEALAIFQNQPNRFDVVITDQTMPGMTGMDLARQLLQIRHNIPIILCTGYSTLINEEQAKAEGVSAFTMKPLTKKGIATLLREVFDENKMAN